MYKLIRFFLFQFEPENAHHFVMKAMRLLSRLPFVSKLIRHSQKSNCEFAPVELFGLKFKNRVGLAAGFDKDAESINVLNDLGFGFVEIGTVTPLAQEGNPKPRLFRLQEDNALINRMGFNSDGLEAIVSRLKKYEKGRIIIGGNIGKNKLTPNESATDDYLQGFHALKSYVDYFVINISSPNTPGLRDLQEREPLQKLLNAVQDENKKLAVRIPILLKISPDLTLTQLDDVIDVVLATNLDGIVSSNTSLSRDNLRTSPEQLKIIGTGGLSGAPLKEKSDDVLQYIRSKTGKNFPIIASGGIMSADDACDKIKAGANLVQLYTGFIYSGPALIKDINKIFSVNEKVLFS